jgi:hypothetical protein
MSEIAEDDDDFQDCGQPLNSTELIRPIDKRKKEDTVINTPQKTP